MSGWVDDIIGWECFSDGTFVARRRDVNFIGFEVEHDIVNRRINIYGGGSTDWKASVRLATAAPLPAYTRVDDTITANGVGAMPNVDGVAPALGDRILLKNGASAIDNGIYDVTDLGSAGTPWIIDRSEDFNDDENVTAGATMAIEEGATYAEYTFRLTTDNPIVVNTTALTFAAAVGGAISGPGTWTGQPIYWDGAAWSPMAAYLMFSAAGAGTGTLRFADNQSLYWDDGAANDLHILSAQTGDIVVGANDVNQGNIVVRGPVAQNIGFYLGGVTEMLIDSSTIQVTNNLLDMIGGDLRFGGVGSSATAGTIRFSHGDSIQGRNNAGTNDIPIIDWGIAGNDEIELGNANCLGMTFNVGGANSFYFVCGAGNQVLFNTSLATFVMPVIEFSDTTATPEIIQHTRNLNAYTGQTMTVHAQNVLSLGGGVSTGGKLEVLAGDGGFNGDHGGHMLVRAGQGTGAGTDGNIAFHVDPGGGAPWNSMERGQFIADVATAPIGAPVGGGYFYSDGGVGTWYGTGFEVIIAGTVELNVNASYIEMDPPILRFQNTTVTPIIQQEQINANGAAELMTINAQDAVNAGGVATGGKLDVRAGDGTGINDSGGEMLVRAGRGNLAGTDGNIALHADPAGWNSMERGIFVGDAATAPAGNPAAGGYLYSSAGAGTWRGSSGTVTVFGPAEPHCPKCGRDAVVSWENEGEGWDLTICMWCAADVFGDAVISKRQK